MKIYELCLPRQVNHDLSDCSMDELFHKHSAYFSYVARLRVNAVDVSAMADLLHAL